MGCRRNSKAGKILCAGGDGRQRVGLLDPILRFLPCEGGAMLCCRIEARLSDPS